MTRSEALFEEAQRFLPGGVNSPVRACRSVGTYPRFLQRGQDSRVWDEDGKEYELEVLSTLEYNGETYMAVIPADAGEEDAEFSLEVSILKSTEEDGEPLLTAIEDEEELKAVYDLMMEELYAEDDTEEEDQ